MSAAFAPMRERAAVLQQTPETVDAVLAAGAERARGLARVTMATVRERMGFLPERKG